MLGWERWHGSERQRGPPLRLQLAVPGHTSATSLQLAAASNSCSALTHYFIMLPLILSFLYIHRYSCTNHSSTMQPASSAWPCPFSLLGQRVNSSRLLSTKTDILLSSTTFLLTFWYPVKYSLKTPNYASLFFFLFKFLLPKDLACNCFQLGEIGSDTFLCACVCACVCLILHF